MGRKVYILVLLLVVSLCAKAQTAVPASPRLIVKLKAGSKRASGDKMSLRQMGAANDLPPAVNATGLTSRSYFSDLSPLSKDSIFVITFSDTLSIDKILYEYRQSGLFEYVETDHIGHAAGIRSEIPDDPGFSQQWYLYNDGTFDAVHSNMGADIDILPGWEVTHGNEAVTVAILDGGIQPDHLEFEGRLWHNQNEIDGNGKDDDGNGFIDDVTGWNFVNGDAKPRDDHGHGTSVAGVLAANGNNGSGYAGIDWHCRLMICKILNSKLEGYYSDWISAIYYAVAQGADVINFSLVGAEPSQSLKEAVAYAYDKGVLIVASMGNDNTGEAFYPAAYPQTLAVGATDPDDRRSIAFNGNPEHGSNYGGHIDVVAPGNYIYGLGSASGSLWSGTSMAAPMVSGIAALLLSVQPNLSPSELTALIADGCEDEMGLFYEDTRGWDQYHGWGRVNAHRSLTLLADEREIREENEIILFPVPADEILNIHYKMTFPSEIMVELIDNTGKQVERLQFAASSVRAINATIDISQYRPGIYFLRIFRDNTIRAKAFIKY